MGDGVNSKRLSDVIEKNVAGIDDGRVEAHHAVSLRSPAVKRTSIEICISRAISGEVCGNLFRLKHGRGHDDLKHGARSQLRLDSAIQKRRFFIGVERLPFFLGDSDGKIIGIKSWAANHSEDFAGARIHRHHGTLLAGHVCFGDGLQIVVDGELNRFARNGFHVVEGAHDSTYAVDDDTLHSVGAFQLVVIFFLESRFAHEISRTILSFAVIHVLHRYFTDIANCAGQHGIMWISAPLDHHEFEYWYVGAMGVNEGDVRFTCGRLDYYRKEFRFALGGFEFLLQIGRVDSKPVFDLGKTFLQRFQVVSHEQDAKRGVAIDEHAALAVKHGSTRRDNRDGTNAIAFGEIDKVARLNHLQLPKTDHQKRDYGDEDIGNQRQPTLGNFLVVNAPRWQLHSCGRSY